MGTVFAEFQTRYSLIILYSSTCLSPNVDSKLYALVAIESSLQARSVVDWPEVDLEKAPNSIFKALTKVNSLWPNPRLVIALHSPYALLETGLPICLPEKTHDSTVFDAEQSILWKSGLPVNDREIRALFAYFGAERTEILVKTTWRSAQSRANFSPREFPANREKYREFFQFEGQIRPLERRISLCFLLDSAIHFQIGTGKDQGKNKE